MKKITIIFLGFLISGCASTHQYFPVSGQSNLSPGNALIRVDRRSELAGSGRSIEVTDDGKVIGQVAPGEFLIWQRPAGIFELKLVPNKFLVTNPIPIRVDAKSGQFCEFEIFWGNHDFELRRKIPQLPAKH